MSSEVRLKRGMFPVVGDVVTWDGEGWVAQAPLSRRGVIGLRGIQEWIRVSPAMEGADIDIAGGTLTIGRGGDSILVFDSGGQPLGEYAATSAGLDAATSAAASGDVVWLPAVTISGDHTLAAGVCYIGVSRWATKLSGAITLGDGTTLECVTVERTANDASDLKGVIAPASGSAKIRSCDVTCTQSGAGDAYGVAVESGGDLWVWASYVNGDSTGGSGYGGYHKTGETGNLYILTGRAAGSTGAFNE